MTFALRVALLLDPLSAHMKGGEHAHELGRELRRRGHDVRAFGAATAESATDDSAIARLAPSSVIGFAPDAIVAYDALSPAAWLGARAARRLRVPLIVVEAGLFVRGTLLERSLWRIGHSLWGAYVRRTTADLVALDSVARDLALRDGFDARRCRIVPHGVDPERFRPGLASGLVARHRIVGRVLSCVSNHDGRSGLEPLIGAFARTLGQRGDWALAIAGRGAGHARARACAERLGVGSRVHFLADAEPDDLPGLYAASTLYAEPTLDLDKPSVGVLHALACGVPALVSKLQRLDELVSTSGAGSTVEPGSVDAWARAISAAASSPDARARWGASGLAYARERSSWAHVAAAFETTIRAARGGADEALPLAS
ncbi:MAG: glycosyltransferase family 4 protein [Planctomycetes bacterium]|nr:glycosyltransferase family 4 protein [Planctomycetota bacterium]